MNEAERKPISGKERMDPMISAPDSNEYVNAISHLLGAILAGAALIVLVVFAALQAKWVHLIGFAIYGVTLLLSMIASCLLHFFLLFGRYKRVLGVLDHSAIYVLIAGTYTPFCLTIFSPAVGWTLFGIIWGLAIFFITLKAIFFARIPVILSSISYLIMGWLVLFFIYPIYTRLGQTATILMLVGGLFFTIGALVFARERPNPFPPYFGNHEIWHLCVLFGNATFFLIMLLFVLPYTR